jgi:hypothetical protein
LISGIAVSLIREAVSKEPRGTPAALGVAIATLGAVLVPIGCVFFLNGIQPTNSTVSVGGTVLPSYNFSGTYSGLLVCVAGVVLVCLSFLVGSPISRLFRGIYRFSPFPGVVKLLGQPHFEVRGQRNTRLILGTTLVVFFVNLEFFLSIWLQIVATIPAPLEAWVINLELRVAMSYAALSLFFMLVLAVTLAIGGFFSDVAYWWDFVRTKANFDGSLFDRQSRIFLALLRKPRYLLLFGISAVQGLVGLLYGPVVAIEGFVFLPMLVVGYLLYTSLEQATEEVGLDERHRHVVSQGAARPAIFAATTMFATFGCLVVIAGPLAIIFAKDIAAHGAVQVPLAGLDFSNLLNSLAVGADTAVQNSKWTLEAAFLTLLFGIGMYLFVFPYFIETLPSERKYTTFLTPILIFTASFVASQVLQFVFGDGSQNLTFGGILNSAVLAAITAFLTGVKPITPERPVTR